MSSGVDNSSKMVGDQQLFSDLLHMACGLPKGTLATRLSNSSKKLFTRQFPYVTISGLPQIRTAIPGARMTELSTPEAMLTRHGFDQARIVVKMKSVEHTIGMNLMVLKKEMCAI